MDYSKIGTIILVPFLVVFFGLVATQRSSIHRYPAAPLQINWYEYHTDYVAEYTSMYGEEDANNIQCPIPMEDRVRNYTGIQCVYSSIEMLGRWAEEPKLVSPPITSRSDCKGYSSPRQAAEILNKLNVRFEQSYGDRNASLRLLKKAMSEGRGALFGVPGHAMVLVHYSEEEDRVCWVDNSDRSLKVQSMTIRQFKSRWDSWILVIYADKDVVPYKVGSLASKLPIVDRTLPQGQYPKDYIPMPGR